MANWLKLADSNSFALNFGCMAKQGERVCRELMRLVVVHEKPLYQSEKAQHEHGACRSSSITAIAFSLRFANG